MIGSQKTNLYDTAVWAMFTHEETSSRAPCGDDLIVWPDDESCNAEDLPGMNHKSDDYIRVPIDSDAYDIVDHAMR